jgi:hypothetical protein
MGKRRLTLILLLCVFGSGCAVLQSQRPSSFSRVFFEETADLADRTWESREMLSDWSDSKGNRLAKAPVIVEAGRAGNRVFALITPASVMH